MHSIVFEFRLVFQDSKIAPSVIAKVSRKALKDGDVGREASQLARAEFETLGRVYSYYSEQADCLAAVRPIDYLSECAAMLVEKAAGEDLSGLATSRQTDCSEHFAKFGRWLHAFHHRHHQSGYRPWDVAIIEAELKTERDKLVTRDVSPKRLDSLIEAYLKKARSLPPQEVPVSVVHGDCRLRHVWASPESLQVLDFGCVTRGDCYNDLSSFLADLLQIEVTVPWISRKKLAAYRHSLLTGYFGETSPPEILSLYIVRSLYLKWCVRLDLWGTPRLVYLNTLRRACRREQSGLSTDCI